MQETAYFSLVALGLSLMLVPLCRYVARRFGFVAIPRADRWHGRPIALLGGVAIAATVLGLHVAILGFTGLPVLLGAGAAMFAIGLVDDLVSLRPATKLVFEIVVASLLVFFGYRLGWVTSLTLDTLMTVFWIVGLTNAFNLLDNMDGLCAGLALVAGIGLLAALTLDGVSGPETTHLALLLGAIAGFLVYNFKPATIFMGDSGSLFLGLNLSVLTIASPAHAQASTSLLSVMAAPALILLVPILDTTLVTVSRLWSGRSAAQGGRDHCSHRLVAIGLSERAAVLVLWTLASLGGLLGVVIGRYQDDVPSLAAAVFVGAAVVFALFLLRVRIYDETEQPVERSSRLTPFVVNFVYRRRIVEVFVDVCLVALAYYGAYRIRFPGREFGHHFPEFLQSLPLLLAVQMVSLFLVGSYKGFWRSFMPTDSLMFAKGVGFGTLATMMLVYAYAIQQFSARLFVTYAVLLTLMLIGSRMGVRLLLDPANRRSADRRVGLLAPPSNDRA